MSDDLCVLRLLYIQEFYPRSRFETFSVPSCVGDIGTTFAPFKLFLSLIPGA
jgi:hypothetical protein